MMNKCLAQARGLEKADLVLKNGKVVNVFTNQILEADIAICDGIIVGVGQYDGQKEIDLQGQVVAPGLIDAHIHIESSTATPSTLSQLLLAKGTTTIVADPHEIVNAAGAAGLDFMLEDADRALMDIYYMIPSSVPSTDFEANGCGEFSAEDIAAYLAHPRILGLGEVMRSDDVLEAESRMQKKLSLFDTMPVDGHAPHMGGKELQAYKLAGIGSDHEAITVEEAIERLQNGFQLFLREGSGARNLETLLLGLLEQNIPLNNCSFCTDDKHLEDLQEEGHMDWCLKLAVDLGCPPIEAIKMATINTARYFNLKNKGAIAPGYAADLVVFDNLRLLNVQRVFKDGKEAADLQVKRSVVNEKLRSSVKIKKVRAADLTVPTGQQHLIGLVDHQLLTRHLQKDLDAQALSLPDSTYNLLCCLERYGHSGAVQTCLLEGFNLKGGAIALSYAHDAHNIIAAGDNREDIALAINTLQEIEGGYVLVRDGKVAGSLPMPVAGVMSDAPAEEIISRLNQMLEISRQMGISEGVDPFANLSFLALPVIPEIRLSDRGLYDVTAQKFLHNKNV